jgi:hypothetical protein
MANPESKIQKGLSILRTQGVMPFLKKFVSSIQNRIYLRQKYFVYEWVSQQRQLTLPDGFVLVKITDSEGLNKLSITNQPIKDLISSGVVVFYILSNNLIAHTTMIATKKEHKIDVLAPKMDYEGIGYIGACETAEEHRGKGLYSYTITEAAKHLESIGRKAIITTDELNQASIKGIEHAGFKLRGVGLYTKILFWDLWKEISVGGDKQ